MSDNYPTPIINTKNFKDKDLKDLSCIQREIKGENNNVLYIFKIIKLKLQ